MVKIPQIFFGTSYALVQAGTRRILGFRSAVLTQSSGPGNGEGVPCLSCLYSYFRIACLNRKGCFDCLVEYEMSISI